MGASTRTVAGRWLEGHSVVASERKRLKLYHGSPHAAEIIRSGFDLRKVKTRWTNDYAVSTLTSPKAILKYFAQAPMPIVEMLFDGVLATTAEARALVGRAGSPQAYTAALVAAGVDAVVLDGSSPKQVFVYNPAALSNLRLWTP